MQADICNHFTNNSFFNSHNLIYNLYLYDVPKLLILNLKDDILKGIIFLKQKYQILKYMELIF